MIRIEGKLKFGQYERNYFKIENNRKENCNRFSIINGNPWDAGEENERKLEMRTHQSILKH